MSTSLVLFGILFFAFGTGTPIAVAYAAWRGYPKKFTRDSFFRGAILLGAAGGGLFIFSQHIVPTTYWQFVGVEICGYSGLLLLFVAMGFGLSIFTLRRPVSLENKRAVDVPHMRGLGVAKLLLWVFSWLAVAGLLFWMIVNPDVPGKTLFVVLYTVLSAFMALGTLWMIYYSFQHEKSPWPMILLAFVPFAFLWYYFERVRTGKYQESDQAG